jgi:hypothetical protein
LYSSWHPLFSLIADAQDFLTGGQKNLETFVLCSGCGGQMDLRKANDKSALPTSIVVEMKLINPLNLTVR